MRPADASSRYSAVLITGATSGLGLALARLYADRGYRLVLVGRKPLEALDAPLFTPETYCQADLSSPHAADRVLEFAERVQLDGPLLLIHNAGVGLYGEVSAHADEAIKALLEVNLYAPIALTHALLPHTKKVVFISSVAADVPAPDYAAYAASKAGLDAFARNLRLETRGAVQVQTVHPGAIRTPMHIKSGVPEGKFDAEKFPTTETVAEEVFRAVAGRRNDVSIGLSNTLLRFTGTYLAAPLDTVMRRMRGRSRYQSKRVGVGKARCAITGAASGIGRALAAASIHRGYEVVGIDADAAGLSRVAEELGPAFFPIQADLRNREALADLAAQLAEGTPLHAFIHSAGINAVGAFAGSSPDAQRAVLEVNLDAPLLLSAQLLRRSALEARSSLVFISSLSHFVGYPGAAVYAASKTGLAAYARSLSVALAPQVHVLTVYPGPTRTPHAARYSPDKNSNKRAEARRMSPDVLADKIVRAVEARHPVLVPGLSNKGMALVGRLAPGFTGAVMRRAIFDKLR